MENTAVASRNQQKQQEHSSKKQLSHAECGQEAERPREDGGDGREAHSAKRPGSTVNPQAANGDFVVRVDDAHNDDAHSIDAAAHNTVQDKEAYRELLSRAERSFGDIPPSVLVDHLFVVCQGGDWPVLDGAMRALRRRFVAYESENLHVTKRPKSPYGTYSVSREGKRRPYKTCVYNLAPLHCSCDCPDFLRSSLAVCKHAMAVLSLLGSENAFEGPIPIRTAKIPELSWTAVRPLVGHGDWLEGVRFTSRGTTQGNQASKKITAMFLPQGDGQYVLRKIPPATEPAARLALIDKLLTLTKTFRAEPPLTQRLKEEQTTLYPVAKSWTKAQFQRGWRSLRKKLYPYQKEGVRALVQRGRLVLADDMGLGKTAQSIAAATMLWTNKRVKRGLIIVPASLKSQWQREWKTFSNAPIAEVVGGAKERHKMYRACERGFLITNYESVRRDLDAIIKWDPDLVILDEAQRIKNWHTQTAATIKQIQSSYRFVLTGTPFENRLEELASVLEWVDPFALEPTWRFAALHLVRQDGGRAVRGVRHLHTLRSRTDHCIVRRVRQEVLKQLPPRTDTVIPVELTAGQLDAHDALNRRIVQLMEAGKKRPLRHEEFIRLMQLLTRQRMICNGMALVDFEEMWPDLKHRRAVRGELQGTLLSPKLAEFCELIERLVLEQQQKVVVFSSWRRMLTLAQWAVSPMLRKHGYSSAFFSGQEKLDRRTENVINFHDDPKAALLLATDAGGVGLNLQRAATACVNLDLPWNPAVLEQRIGRIYRLGQTQPVSIYNLVANEGIESRIHILVGNKQKVFSGFFDGDSDEVCFNDASSFLQRLEIAMPKRDLAAIKGKREMILSDEAPVETLESLQQESAGIIVKVQERSTNENVGSAPTLGAQAAEVVRAAAIVEGGNVTTTSARNDPQSQWAQMAGKKPSSAEQPQALAAALSKVHVRREPDGRTNISAPPEVAAVLGKWLSSLGESLLSHQE